MVVDLVIHDDFNALPLLHLSLGSFFSRLMTNSFASASTRVLPNPRG